MANEKVLKQICVNAIVWLEANYPEVFEENNNPCDKLRKMFSAEVSIHYNGVSKDNIYFCNQCNKIYALDCVCK
jgi:hypothetical protein